MVLADRDFFSRCAVVGEREPYEAYPSDGLFAHDRRVRFTTAAGLVNELGEIRVRSYPFKVFCRHT